MPDRYFKQDSRYALVEGMSSHDLCGLEEIIVSEVNEL